MRKITFGRRHPGHYLDGVVHAGDGVVTYSRGQWRTRLTRLRFNGDSQAGRYAPELPEASVSLGVLGGRDGMTDRASESAYVHELLWGTRYADVRRLGVTEEAGGRQVFTSVVLSHHGPPRPRMPAIQYGDGPKGGLVFQHRGGGPLVATNTSIAGEFTIPVDPSPFEPSSLIAVSQDQQTAWRLSDFNIVVRWAVTASVAFNHHVDTIPIAVPRHYNHLLATDLAVSPDGRTLYVAWSNLPPGEPDTPVGLSVYDAETRAVRTHFDFPACLLAPSPDGQTLAFLAGFGGAQNKTTLYEIDLD